MSIRSVGVAGGGRGKECGCSGGREGREENQACKCRHTALPDGVHVGHVYTWVV